MKRILVAVLIGAGTLIPTQANAAMPSHCAYTTTQAYRYIAATGNYLPRFRCAIGEEDSRLVQRALWEYRKNHS